MLDDREKMQIAEIVNKVIDHKLDELRKEILEGFVEALDWHNDNFAKIMEQTNNSTVAQLTKTHREVIEIRSQEVAAEREKSARRGFTAKAAGR
jgi:hypothetical protein